MPSKGVMTSGMVSPSNPTRVLILETTANVVSISRHDGHALEADNDADIDATQ